LVFLLWAWAASFFHHGLARIPLGRTVSAVSANLQAGIILLEWEDSPPPARSGGKFRCFWRRIAHPADPWTAEHWWPAFQQRKTSWLFTGPPGLPTREMLNRLNAGEGEELYFQIRRYPMWMVIAGYLMLWGLMMWVRHRRLGREIRVQAQSRADR
jgi:hypothetical protein